MNLQMDTEPPKLYYFDVKGRAEPTRQMFKLSSVKFDDIRYTFQEWGQVKSSSNSGWWYNPRKLCIIYPLA